MADSRAVVGRALDHSTDRLDHASAPLHRRDDIQGLRAIAVLMVVGYHAGLPMPGGFTGVDVFFVISGFVITLMLRREWQGTGNIAFGRFYLRRFRRLTPALALMVATTLVFSMLFISPLGPLLRTLFTGVGAIGLMANVVISGTTGGYFDPAAETNALLHTWSLSVEEQFYLVFPLLLHVSWRWLRRIGRFVPAALVGAVLTASFGLALAGGGSTPDFYSPFTRAWEFAAGALLVLVHVHLRPFGRRTGALLAASGVALLIASVALVSSRTPFPGVWTLVPVAGTLVLIVAGFGENPVSRLLGSRWAVAIGDRSYSIYLWHWPFIAFAATLWPADPGASMVAAALSLVPAYLSYRFVEEPLRRQPIAAPRQLARWIGVVIVVPVAVAVVVAGVLSTDYGSPLVTARQEAIQVHVATTRGCHIDDPDKSWREADCTWNVTATGAPIYLVGDSNADQFSESVIGAGEQLKRPVVISTHGSCPLLEARLWNTLRSDAWNRGCETYVDDTVRYLTRAAPGLVVVAAADRYLRDDGYGFGPSKQAAVTGREERLAAWTEGTTRLVHDLERAGHTVLLVHTVPRWEGPDMWSPSQCTIAGLLAQGDAWCGHRMVLSAATERQRDARTALAGVAGATSARLLDLGPAICPDGTCTSAFGPQVSYRDFEHITITEAVSLVPQFVQAIRG